MDLQPVTERGVPVGRTAHLGRLALRILYKALFAAAISTWSQFRGISAISKVAQVVLGSGQGWDLGPDTCRGSRKQSVNIPWRGGWQCQPASDSHRREGSVLPRESLLPKQADLIFLLFQLNTWEELVRLAETRLRLGDQGVHFFGC